MKKGNSKYVQAVVIIFFALINFILISFLKYNINGLSIREFKFDYLGNVLNLVILAGIIIASISMLLSKKILSSKRIIFAASLLGLSLILPLFIIATSRLSFIDESTFIIGISARKVYLGVILMINLFIQIYSMVYIWGLLFEVDRFHELRALLHSVIVMLLFFVLTLFYVWNVNTYSHTKLEKKCEYGLIPGAAVWKNNKPSPLFEARIKKALQLIKNGIIEKIIVTGGNAPGEITEAEAAMVYLQNMGVPRKSILLERNTSTTSEQVKFIRLRLFPDKKDSSVIFISDGFHLSRITQIAKYYQVKSIGVASKYQMSFNKALFYRTREAIALLLFWFFAI